ncbi:MAG: hypothetical protein HC769_20725 [Cyanobacteria bacterium CRU_2_1]|nr:hypothetical protein [Cyanobacteria bacterium RU_5_0]NJR61034.1 hypothetical protein [Cyanobacteria bacterium CRU_2_1]
MTRKLVSFRLADDVRQALKERAGTEGISITELINRLLRQSLFESSTNSMNANSTIEVRLSVLEVIIQEIIKRTDLGQPNTEWQTSSSSTQPRQEVEQKLVEMEERLEKMSAQLSAGVEESRQNLRQLAKAVAVAVAYEKNSAADNTEQEAWGNQKSQDTFQGYRSNSTKPVSLNDLRKLLKSDD